MSERPFRIGTRGSPLALKQAEMVAAALGASSELVIVKTVGDRVQDRPLAEIGGRALWTKELDWRLAQGEIDMAVHSMKDVESERPGALALAAVLPRADPRDRLIGVGALALLRPGMRVGTTSPRRIAQLARAVPRLVFVPFRGNVATRLGRIEAGEADATLLAAAGLDRLGKPHVGTPIDPQDMPPAPGQAIIGVEVRADDSALRERLAQISDNISMTALRAERAFARALGGSCNSPVAAHARPAGDAFLLTGEILSIDGAVHRRGERRFAAADAEAAGADLAQALLANAPPALAGLFGG